MKSPKVRSWRLGTAVVGLGAMITVAAVQLPALADTPSLKVTNVTLSTPATGSAEVVVSTSSKPTYTVRVADGGTRLIVDLSSAAVDGAPPAIVEGNDVVAGVMTQAFGTEGATRVLVQLAHTATYRVQVAEDGLKIILVSADKTTAATTATPATPGGGDAPSKPSVVHVSDVRFDHITGRDRVFIMLDGDAKYTESSTKTSRRIEITSASLPTTLERTLDTGAFNGAVHSVSSYRKKSDPTTVVIDVDCDESATSSVVKEGKGLVLTVSTGAPNALDTGKAADGGAARRSRTISREEAPADVPNVTTTYTENAVESDQADAFLPGMSGDVKTDQGQEVKTAGRRIEMDLKDADIHDVLRLFANVGHVNIVTADNVSGSVSITLHNVPWDLALDTILQAKGLGMVRKGNLIRIAPISDLNKERELALARRKSEFELAPIETRLIPISYANAGDMEARAKDLLSPRGSVAVDERTNVLIVRDVAGNVDQIEELTRALDTQTPQVLIEARIVEAGSTFSREVGIQWGGDATFSQSTGNDTGIAFPNSIGLAGGATDGQTPTAGLSPTSNNVTNPNFAVNLPAAAGLGSGGALGLVFGSVDGNFNINVRLSALEATGMGRIISSPRILTLDNKTARISSGTLIPFSQVGAQGVQTVFQEAKLQLLVTPHVTADGSVSMQVKINRDEPDFSRLSARGDPTILKREVETELLLQDGHTAVIGGIYTRNSTRNINQVPLLGDIPILGVLFQKRTTKDDRTELVVFLTPRIVNRSESLGH
ncbi:MAG: type IV pilus secretin PilQ [Polyangiaceae bacterium]